MSLGLVVALQKLFFHLMHGNKSAINPSEALSLIVDDKGEPIVMGDELDLGEFLINFLERVKEGVLLSSQLATYDKIKRPNNPIDSLFFGTCKEKITYENSRTNSESSREISLGPINLSLEQKDVLASLKAYMNFDVEKTEQGRLIQGRKEIIITKTPKVLTLLPQRVTYHPTKGLVKVADALEVPRRISLDCFVKRDNNDKSSVAKLTNRLEVLSDLNRPINEISTENYKLHSAIIHDGDAVSGHYYTLVYHELKRQWIRFNDSVVSHISEQEGFDLVRGGGGGGVERKHMPCGYCVFYVKEDFESSRAHLLTRNEESTLNIESSIAPTMPQVSESPKLLAQKQEIIDLYLVNLEHITLQAAKWDQNLNENCTHLPSIPSFHAFLFSNSVGCDKFARWTVLLATVKYLNNDANYNNPLQINAKDTDQKECLEQIVKDFINVNMKSLQLDEKQQEKLMNKQSEYKEFKRTLVMLKVLLTESNKKDWENLSKFLRFFDKKLAYLKGCSFLNNMHKFFEFIFRVLLLKYCEVAQENWIAGNAAIAVNLVECVMHCLNTFRWLRPKEIFSLQIVESLTQIVNLSTSQKGTIDHIHKIRDYISQIQHFSSPSQNNISSRPTSSMKVLSKQNSLAETGGDYVVELDEDNQIFYSLQSQDEDLENLYVDWQSNFGSCIETEIFVRETNKTHCPLPRKNKNAARNIRTNTEQHNDSYALFSCECNLI